MLKLLMELFGDKYVKSLIGTRTNISKPIKMDYNSPYKIYSDEAFEDPKTLAVIEEKIKEYAPFAMSNRNASEVKNYEMNLRRLKNAKMKQSGTTPGMIKSIEEAKKPKSEADVLDISTGKKVDDEGIMSLKEDLGLPEGIDPKSKQGKLLTELQRATAGSKKAESLATEAFETFFGGMGRNTMREGQRRAVVRKILLQDDRIDLPEDVRKSLSNYDDLRGGADENMDPLRIFDQFYERNETKFDALDNIIDGSRNEMEAAREFLAEFDGFDLQKVNPGKPRFREGLDDEAVERAEREAFEDPDDLAEGGRPGSGLNNILGV